MIIFCGFISNNNPFHITPSHLILSKYKNIDYCSLYLICEFIICSIETLKLDCNIYHPVSTSDLREGDANGFVQKAISAANVYNNIVKYIDDANITSLTTYNLSQRAEDVRYTTEIHIHCNTCQHSVALLCVLCFRPSLGSICSSGTW